MATSTKPRIKLPEVAKTGDVVEIKALIQHVMETGNRRDPDGKQIPRSIIHTFRANFEGQTVFSANWGSGISANPYIAFYFKVPIEVSLDRLLSVRMKLKYYEAGMDRHLSTDIEQSFRMFQQAVIDEYDRMVAEFGLVVIDATRPIEEQQLLMREIVTQTLTGVRKTRIRKWVDLSSTATGSLASMSAP